VSSTTDRRPLIGIPAGSYNSSHADVKTFRFNGNYTAALAAAGGLPVAIPLDLPEDGAWELFARLDGLCLAGGDDVDPAHYGETPHPALRLVDPLRDTMELRLARWALASDLPVLGICRGIQVLNVAAGGTLYQDLAAQRPGTICHDYEYRAHDSPWERPMHCVLLQAGSRLGHLHDAANLHVNSFHHQAVKDVGDGFVETGWADDGLVEAIEAPDHPFAVGVQWHPEAMARIDVTFRRIFEAFVDAAARTH
jgi:putative glutamine amidotransferase